MTTPQTVNDLFPSPWLSAGDLAGRTITVRIASISLEQLRQPDGRMELKAILSFDHAHKRMILNKTQAQAIAAILGSPVFDDWPGHRITLSVGRAPNGRDTILITPADPAPIPQVGQGDDKPG